MIRSLTEPKIAPSDHAFPERDGGRGTVSPVAAPEHPLGTGPKVPPGMGGRPSQKGVGRPEPPPLHSPMLGT
jgi:hypothetical protein